MLQRATIDNPVNVLGFLKFHERRAIMVKKNQQVVPCQESWAVKGAGSQWTTSVHNTQQQVIDAARDVVRNQKSELVIHRPDGCIRGKDSHGNDNFPSRG